MKRIDVPTATEENLFTGGNPLTGTPATRVSASWLNNVQEEICYVVEQAGITLDGEDTTQLYDAITTIIGTTVPDASETVKGKVELATTAEAVTGTDTARAVTPAGVKAALDALVDAAPGALDTLNELAAALGDDPNFATTVTNALATKQPLDATLTAIAALITAADKLIYATGVDTFATTDLTSFGRTLIAAANASTALTALGITSPLGNNRIINPSGSVYQRSVASTADDTYFADRWYALTQSGAITPSRLTDPEDGYRYGVRLTQAQASAQRFGYAQIIEGINCKDLRGSDVAIRARVRSSTAQNIRIALLAHTGTEDSVTSDVVNNWTSTDYTSGNFFGTYTVVATGFVACSAATFTGLSLSGTLGSTVNNLILVVWTENTCAQNVTLDFDWNAVTKGSSIPAYEPRHITLEEALCHRYYYAESFPQQRLAADTAAGYASTVWGSFKESMRATPSFTKVDGASAAGTQSTYVNTEGWAQTAGAVGGNNAAIVSYTADAEL